MTAEVPQRLTAAQEWRINWLMVLSGLVGVTLGTIPSATLGLFMAPLEAEFGWSRTEISAGLTVFAIVSLPLTPFAGVLVDRYGSRRVALPGIAISALIFASFALMPDSLFIYLGIWTLYTLASLLTRILVWNTAISSAFEASRGLAIAVVLCGSAISMSLSPLVARWLIDGYGWRMGYAGLGLGWGGMVLLLVLLFFKDRRPSTLASETGGARCATPAAKAGGLTVKEAVRSVTINRIALAIFLQSLMGASIMVHLVPLLVGSGLTRLEAVGLAALLGAASVCGKLVTGAIVDRVQGSILPVTVFTLPALAYAFMLQAHGSMILLAASVLMLGYASGAGLQMGTYLTTRYAGLRNFGTIFGLISSLMAVAAGIGPLAAGIVFDLTGDYRLLMMIGIPAAIVAGLSLFGLGPYPRFDAIDNGKPDGA
ncbi:MAG: MFS transporter [Novosphingobium sp.]|nr:MFS transporter [Novosphingobium sp.]